MNREQRRAEVKKMQKQGTPKALATQIVNLKDYMEKHPSTAGLKEGQAVKLNISQLLRGDVDAMNQKYVEFVRSAEGRVFHVHQEDKLGEAIVSLQEEPTWLFWQGDLIPYIGGGDTDAD